MDGYLINLNDTDVLSNYINQLATDRDLLLRLSMNAVKRYKIQPKWVETAKNIRYFLHDIVRGDASTALHSAQHGK